MADERLEIAIKAVNEASKALKEVQKDLGGLDDQAKKTGGGFGGLSNAAKAAVVGGIGLLAVGLHKTVEAAMEAEKVTAATEAVIRSTGGAAGLTAKEVGDLATKLSEMSGVDDELIQSAENVLLTFTKIKGDVFPAATEAALNMSVALGTDLQGSIIQVGKALNDPIKGVTALQRVGVSFDASQKKLIKTMVAMGDTAGAQALILKELETEFGGAAKAAGDTFAGKLGKAQVALGNLAESIGNRLLPILADLADRFVEFIGEVDAGLAVLGGNATEIERQQNLVAGLTHAYGENSEAVRQANQVLTELQQKEALEIAFAKEEVEIKQRQQASIAELRGIVEEELIPTEEDLAKAEEAAAKAAEEQAKALDKVRNSSADAATGFFGLAQAYAEGVTTLDTVKRALDAIDEAERKGIITDSERRTAQEQIMLQYGLTTESGLIMARAEEEVNQLFDAGLISAENYTDALVKIPTAAKDGKVSMDELGEGARIAASRMGDAEQRAEQLRDRIGQLESKEITIMTHFQELHEEGGGGPGGRQFGGPVAGGRAFMVGERGPELFVPGMGGGIVSNTDTRRMIALLEAIAGGLSRPSLSMTVNTAQGVDTAREFSLMRALAGAF